MRLTKNFVLKELTASQTASRLNIDQTPSDQQIAYLTNLCCMVLQPIREHFGKVLTISSGFRHPDLCSAIGSKPTSEHCCIDGAAADFELYGIDNLEVATWIRDVLDYNQLILEDYTPPNGGWIHCSYKPVGNKHDVKTMKKNNGKPAYEEGLCP